MQFRYDPEGDVLYVALRPHPGRSYARDVDEQRFIMVDENGEPIAVEFLDASEGIDLTDIPEADAIRGLFKTVLELRPLRESTSPRA